MDIVSLVTKVLSGHASPDERQQLETWKAQRTANIDEFESLRLLWEYSSKSGPPERSDPGFYDGLIQIKARIAAMKQKKKETRKKNNFAAITGAVLLGVSILILIQRFSRPSYVQLRFDHVPLENVIKILRKELNIEITVSKNEVLSCRFTGIFYGRTSSTEIIETLATAMDLKYEVLSPGEYKVIEAGCNH